MSLTGHRTFALYKLQKEILITRRFIYYFSNIFCSNLLLPSQMSSNVALIRRRRLFKLRQYFRLNFYFSPVFINLPAQFPFFFSQIKKRQMTNKCARGQAEKKLQSHEVNSHVLTNMQYKYFTRNVLIRQIQRKSRRKWFR